MVSPPSQREQTAEPPDDVTERDARGKHVARRRERKADATDVDERDDDRENEAAVEGAVLRLRPIMMTMLVACFGLVPAALSHAIGSDSQRPFAIVIVGGLVAALLMSLVLLPTLYVWIARDGDKLPEPEAGLKI